MQDVLGGQDVMASRIFLYDQDVRDPLLWGESAVVPAAAERHADSEPPTIRSARSQDLDDDDAEASLAGGLDDGASAAPAALDAEDVDVPIDFDDEPCPATLRSPVASGISAVVQRARVA